MDPISIIVTALAAGAVAALKPTAEQAIKDAYANVKARIQGKYRTLTLEALEQVPDSETNRAQVAEDLTDAGARDDTQLLDQAKFLLDAIKAYDRPMAATLNINFEQVEAAYFKIKKAAAEGNVNIGIKKGTFSGGIDMEGLTAGTPLKKL